MPNKLDSSSLKEDHQRVYSSMVFFSRWRKKKGKKQGHVYESQESTNKNNNPKRHK